MDYIIFDMETVMARKSEDIQHLLEIGAVRISDINGKLTITDEFHTYVKPPYKKLLSNSILNFIGANESDFSEAPNSYKAVQNFRKWIGKEKKDYFLCGWSDSELWILAQNNAKLRLELGWVKNFIDIQPIISQRLVKKNHMSLQKAILLAGVDVKEKTYHSAIFDAYSTASLLIEYFDDIKGELIKNSNPFSVVSVRIMRECKVCKKTKFYKSFRLQRKQRSTTCYECTRQGYLKRKAMRECENKTSSSEEN